MDVKRDDIDREKNNLAMPLLESASQACGSAVDVVTHAPPSSSFPAEQWKKLSSFESLDYQAMDNEMTHEDNLTKTNQVILCL
jgi:hypothetical protein